MKTPHKLRREAERYRRLATDIDDRRAIDALRELAIQYEELAVVLEREQLVRRRAYEIWEQQGRPHGRHADHWVAAERELADAASPECPTRS
jgi:Protein of unknown function (DUF2934)